MEEILVTGRSCNIHTKEWFLENGIEGWEFQKHEKLFGKRVVIGYPFNLGCDTWVLVEGETKSNTIKYKYLDADTISKEPLDPDIVKLAKDLIAKYPKVYSDDIGSGGCYGCGYDLAKSIAFIIEKGDTKILLPTACGSQTFPTSDIQEIVNGDKRELVREFDVTSGTHIRRSVTFYKENENLPKTGGQTWR